MRYMPFLGQKSRKPKRWGNKGEEVMQIGKYEWKLYDNPSRIPLMIQVDIGGHPPILTSSS
jgi:hypothetical protein